MPIYEMNPSDVMGADIGSIKQPEPQYGESNDVGILDAANPFSDKNEVSKLRDAAFRIDNSVGSLIATMPFNQFEDQDGYNPFDDERTLTGYEDFADAFIHSKSPEETSAIKQRINRQIQDRQMLQDAGGAGLISSIAMGVIDPINVAAMMIPAGTIVRGGDVLATASKFAVSNTLGGVASELALSATQETRTLEESALNVTFDAMLGGLLGSAAQLVKNRGQIVSKLKNDVLGEQQTIQQNTPDNTSIGAMEVPDTTLEQETLKGPSFINRTMNVSPVGRVAQSPSKTARQINQQLAENNFTFAKNEEGIASFTAVETKVRGYETLVYKQVESTKDFYKTYRKMAKERDGSRLSLYEFSEQVGDAMRNGDRHAIPEVAEAARGS